MGIYCDIIFNKPSNGEFVGTTGNIVSGIIKYAVDEDTAFTKIIVSLKGLGAICLENYHRDRNGLQQRYFNTEKYIDIDNVIESNEKGLITPIGAYEIPFNFIMPHNVPPSVNYFKCGAQCKVMCCIKYYIRIKFNRRGIMNFTRRFKKPIKVVSGILPRLSTTPIMYGGDKKLTQLLKCSTSSVNVKANILNSVLKRGDKIEFHYELTNNSKLTINGVETELVEVHKFFINIKKPIVTEFDKILGTDSKTCAVKSGETQEMFVEIRIPLDRESVEFSNIYSREYCVFITVHLPMPHRNYVLKLPVQIGNVIEESVRGTCVDEIEEPPSYWEAMNEYITDDIELDELENSGKVSK